MLVESSISPSECQTLCHVTDPIHLSSSRLRNWSTTWPAATARNRSHHRVKEEIAQLKGKVSQVNKTNQRLQQKLLQNERGASSVSNESSATKEMQAFQRDIWLFALNVYWTGGSGVSRRKSVTQKHHKKPAVRDVICTHFPYTI